MSPTPVTISRTYKLGNGDPASGTVTFRPTAGFQNEETVVSAPVIAPLSSSGAISVVLYANTDPDTTPEGTAYRVREELYGHSSGINRYDSNNGPVVNEYYVEVPHDAGSSLDLSDLAEVVPGPILSAYQPSDVDLTAIAGLSPSNDDFLQRKSGAWANRSIAQVQADLGVDTSPSGFTGIINVKDAPYSATGDGSTDDTAALQAALDAVAATGGMVFLPPGRYRITATLLITDHNVMLFGAGPGQRVGATQNAAGSQIEVATAGFTGTAALRVSASSGTTPLHGVTLRDFSIDCRDVGSGVDGIHYRSNRSLIDHVYVYQATGAGIRLEGYAAWDLYDSVLRNVQVSECAAEGVLLAEGATDMHFEHCILFNNNDNMALTGGGSCQVTGCHFYDAVRYNILFNGAGSRSKFANCKIEGAGQHGVLIDSTVSGYSDIQISGCNFANNGDSAVNTYDHIMTMGPSGNGITRLNIGHNAFSNKTGNTNLARYGVNFSTTSMQTATVIGNTFGPASHFGTGPFNDSGSGGSVRQIRDNGGLITEASGTATVASGATTVVVTHGLGRTPSSHHISVTPTNSMGNATKYFISTVGATTFTINVNVDPGATTATFAWNAGIV